MYPDLLNLNCANENHDKLFILCLSNNPDIFKRLQLYEYDHQAPIPELIGSQPGLCSGGQMSS